MERKMTRTVTIFGGSGFIGRYIVRRMIAAGWRVIVAMRSPANAAFLMKDIPADQIGLMSCDLRDDASVLSALKGADAVVNCVGILLESGTNTFRDIQAEGAARIARLASAEGISRMVQISAIGADTRSASVYSKTKGQGEDAVLTHQPNAVILRPSIVFGVEDQFFNRFASMTQFSPMVPVVGAATRFQPVYVDDVARAAEMGVLGQAAAGVYELGGPEVETFHGLMKRMLDVINRRRIILNLPMPMARLMAFGFDTLQKLSFGVITNGMITQDQIRNLSRDNVVSDDARGFADLGIEPVPMDAILPGYLGKSRAGATRND
jgi:NADH dehydrogenase